MGIRIKILACMVLVLFSMSSVFALGVTPGRTTINFEPGLDRTYTFKIVNSEGKDVNLGLYIKGDDEIINYIKLKDSFVRLSSNDLQAEASFTVNFPKTLTPGHHNLEIVIGEVFNDDIGSSRASVGAVAAVSTQIRVFVPYPGKYIEAALNVLGNGSEEILFTVPVINRGQNDISRIGVQVDIYSDLNKKIDTVDAEEVSLSAGTRDEFKIKWDDRDVLPGKYKAVATIIYDEETIRIESNFDLGEKLLEIQGLEVNDFELGEISKFELLVENKWSEPIYNAYSEIMIYDNGGDIMTKFKSADYNVDSFGKKIMVSFWDTEGVAQGRYLSTLVLNYANEITTKEFEVEIGVDSIRIIGIGHVIAGANKEEPVSVVFWLVLVIVLLLAINILWFLFFRRTLNKK